MRSQKGGEISIGLGITHFRSSKQKLNTKRSIDAELVGARDYMLYNIWYIMFMNHQGYLNKLNNFPKTIKM